MRKRKIIFVIAEDWYFWSHRLPLATAARDAGYEVLIATRVHEHGAKILNEGFKLIPLRLSRESYSPWTELRTVLQLWQLYRIERPDIVQHVALKPILYGSIAALGKKHTRVINALAGLGYLVASSSWKAKLLRVPIWSAFRLLLNRSNTSVLLQNGDDMEMVVTKLRVPVERAFLVRGAGVDCGAFCPSPPPEGIPVVILPSRMLWNKGVAEFVAAAESLQKEGIKARFVLVGRADPASPSGIPPGQLTLWHEQGTVEWWGHKQDMTAVYHSATVVCLPSHGGEGIPKSLLEAAACGRPIITCDVPGCREIVRDHENGLLVRPKDVAGLVRAIRSMLASTEMRKQMGDCGRVIALNEFAQEIVVSKTLELYDALSTNT
jgi:glycosyltransferase involved in cell wall biosynthesis